MVTKRLTSGADTYTGPDTNDTIYGLGGNDRIDGGYGADTIYGGLVHSQGGSCASGWRN